MYTVLLSQMAQLFIMIVMGYPRLLLDVTLPLLIISSVMNTDVDVSGAKIGSVFLISFCMYGALSIVIYFLPVTFPEVITGVCHSIGGLTSPLAMLLIGATLSRIPVNNIFNDWRVYLFTIVKQIVVPVLAWPLMKLVIADDLIRSVMFILFLLPVANTAVLFATRFEKDEELAAKTVFVTTLISIATIPGVLSLLHILG